MELSAEFSPPGIFPLQGANVSFFLSDFSPPGIFPLHFSLPGIFPLQGFFFPLFWLFPLSFDFFRLRSNFSPPFWLFPSIDFSPLFFPLPRFFPSFFPSLGTGGDIWWKEEGGHFDKGQWKNVNSNTSSPVKTPQNNPNWHPVEAGYIPVISYMVYFWHH